MKKQRNEIPSRVSESVRKLNPHLYPDYSEASGAKPEQAVRNEPLAKVKRKEAYAGRVLVGITSYRRRLIDPDNLVGKYFVDCCRYSGFLRDDSAAAVGFSITQEKVKSREDERTVIRLTYEQ